MKSFVSELLLGPVPAVPAELKLPNVHPQILRLPCNRCVSVDLMET